MMDKNTVVYAGALEMKIDSSYNQEYIDAIIDKVEPYSFLHWEAVVVRENQTSPYQLIVAIIMREDQIGTYKEMGRYLASTGIPNNLRKPEPREANLFYPF